MKRLLYIAHRLPYPPDKGERVRAFHEIVELAAHFQVTVASLCHQDADLRAADGLRRHVADVVLAPPDGWGLLRGAISLLRGRSLTEAYFRSSRLRRKIADQQQDTPFDVVAGYSSSMLPFVLAADAPVRIIDLVDADSAKWAAYADARGPLGWAYRREAAAVARLEARAVNECDAAVVVSAAEADLIGDQGLHVVANGVDVGTFDPDTVEPIDLGPAALVFVGTMDYRPNVEAAVWFAKHVWPALRSEIDDATLTIVGRQPASAVRRLGSCPGVQITGGVPDVRPFMAGASAMVCPLQTSRGIPNKVLEAMAMARPVVASNAALQALDVCRGRDVLAADTPQQWHEACRFLLADRAAAAALGRAARQCVTERYRWPDRLRPLVDLCRRLTAAANAA